jgi:hypothetical protein
MANTPVRGPGLPTGGIPNSGTGSGGESMAEEAIRMANSRGSGFSSGNRPSSGNTPSSGSEGSLGTGGVDEPAKSMIGGDIDLAQILETINSSILDYLKNFFAPVPVDFTNEILSAQINLISIILFMLTFCILLCFISLLFHIIVYLFSNKLLNYFTNKYLKRYINFNKKFIAFEIIMLCVLIFYLMYMVLYGLHYIAIHPIIL